MDPMHAAAHINLGTLYYNRQEYALAERHYRSAIQIDPRYALAYFDLGNVLDETGRVEEAITTYSRHPASSHLRRRSLQHRAGLREDARAAQSPPALALLRKARHHRPWTVHARHQIQRILQGDTLKLVHSAKPTEKHWLTLGPPRRCLVLSL